MTATQLAFALGPVAFTATLGLVIFVITENIRSKTEFDLRKREQAAIIASLFAEWIDRPEEKKELNRLTWEATPWLPDGLAKEVNQRLANEPTAKNTKEILVDIKGLIQGRKSSLNPSDIVHFGKEKT